MDWFQTLALALIQGLTEFLPVSSSAHLILPSQVLGWQDQGLAFDVAVHVGTLLAVVLYFRRDVISLTLSWVDSVVKRKNSDESRLAWLIVLATIPAGIAGLLLDDFIEENLRSAAVIATTTVLFGVVLWWSDFNGSRERSLKAINWKDALIIGFSQALALIPGTSRSGITMTAALLIGFSRDAAARYSFLLSIPLIAAAGLLKSVELVQTGTDAQWTMIGVGTVAAFLSAYACIHLFLSFLERIGFTPFVIYRLLLGAVLGLYLLL
ncbi:undecaprenyl-diphosphate phosphatase [Alkalimarinus alittae]|uniref:Undecaprenyl-diphosphatase n=1 Tax=Alkalimarinus alittae TaxID=2961619 RepID=A0ABY6N4U1_9ALTE|nr:undecaprenyl-diphosphate phosphatase [Alkalimarinus alittae]UZE97136.1 undecaprenyl-diphosphate phosphatase [Alkalimarinus alittae]